jgi:hypothetical protein
LKNNSGHPKRAREKRIKKLTQQQYADELGWCKIYDAGQRLYVMHLGNQ